MSRSAFLLLPATILCFGCTGAPPSKPVSPEPGVDTAELQLQNGRETLQLPETMLSDKKILSLTRLGILHTYVRRYVDSRGSIPAQLSDLRVVAPQGYDRVSADAWGTAIQYRVNDSRFEFLSAGEDLVFGTSDDLVLAGMVEREEPCFIIRGDGRRVDYDRPCPE